MSGLIEALSQLAGLGREVLWHGFIVFLRVGAAMALMPAFGEQQVPQRIRLVLALAFAAVVAPAVPVGPAMAEGLFPVLASETVIGLALGLGVRLFIHALQIAGAMIAQATSLAQMFGGVGVEPQPAVSHVLTLAGLALAMSSGLHVTAAKYFIFSYDLLPAGQLPGAADIAAWGTARIGQAFALAFSLAAPFVIAAFLFNVALGVINRAMPQLMVSFVGAPALAGGGLVLLAVIAPLLLVVWLRAFNAYLAAPFAAVGP